MQNQKIYKKLLLFLLLVQGISILTFGQNDIELRTDGIVFPRIDKATVILPKLGQVIWDNSTAQLMYNDGTSWHAIDPWKTSGTSIFYNDGNVGVGTISPGEKLELSGLTEAGSSVVLDNTGGGVNASHIELRSQGVPMAQIRSLTSDNLDASLAFKTAEGGNLETRMFISEIDGRVGIGTTLPTSALEVNSNTTMRSAFRLSDLDGQCDHDPQSGGETVSCLSDARLKMNIRSAKSVLEDLMKLKIRDYQVRASGHEMTGLIAQETLEIMPELVREREDGFLMVAEINHWKMVKAIQELKRENDKLQSILTKENELLRKELDELRSLILNKL